MVLRTVQVATSMGIKDPKFVVHNVYRIRTIDGKQQYAREHVLTFLERLENGDLVFNARPFAGTQTFDRRTKFLRIEDLGPGKQGRDDKRHYMNKVLR